MIEGTEPTESPGNDCQDGTHSQSTAAYLEVDIGEEPNATTDTCDTSTTTSGNSGGG